MKILSIHPRKMAKYQKYLAQKYDANRDLSGKFHQGIVHIEAQLDPNFLALHFARVRDYRKLQAFHIQAELQGVIELEFLCRDFFR